MAGPMLENLRAIVCYCYVQRDNTLLNTVSLNYSSSRCGGIGLLT